MDEIDAKILEILQESGRTRRNDLADAVSLSTPSVSERLRKLEETGIIMGYYAKVDPKKLGKDVTAFILVTVDSSKYFRGLIEHAETTAEILECHAVTGEGTHLLKIRTENTSTLEKLLSKIQAWPGVVGTITSVVLSTSKETTKIKVNSLK